MEVRNSCCCCLIRAPDYDLKKPHAQHRNTEVYADILKDCFEIHIVPNSRESHQGICKVCVVRLRDAFNFKHQVIRCQKQLMQQNSDLKHSLTEDVPEEFQEQSSHASFTELPASSSSSCEASCILKKLLCTPCNPSEHRSPVLDSRVDDNTINIEEDLRSDDEQGEVEWLELFSEDDDVGSIGSKYSYESEAGQKIKVDTEDLENELPKLRSLNDSSVEIPSLSEVTVKPMFTRKEDEKKYELKIDKENRSTTQRGERYTELMKYKENMQNILKYSNCTPFFDKSITGITCAYCRKLFQDIESLNRHVSEKHGRETFEPLGLDKRYFCIKLDITDLRCNICDVRLNFIADLKTHLTQEHSIKFYPIHDYFAEFKLTDSKFLKCVVCDSAFETFRMLLRHMNNVHCRNYICDVCDDGFMNIHQLRGHKKTHELGDFKCSLCDKVFGTRVRLKSHENYVHKAGRVILTRCSHCDKTFPSYHQRNSHMFTEHNVKTALYNCNICDKLFTKKSYLTCHIKTVHLMERRHVCVRCGKGFFERRKLVKHMITRNCAREFECDVCHKVYARKVALRQHMRKH